MKMEYFPPPPMRFLPNIKKAVMLVLLDGEKLYEAEQVGKSYSWSGQEPSGALAVFKLLRGLAALYWT